MILLCLLWRNKGVLCSGLLFSSLEEVFSILPGALYSVVASDFYAIEEWDTILRSKSNSQYGCPMELGSCGALHGRSGMPSSAGREHVPAPAVCCTGLLLQVQLSALHFPRRTCCTAFLWKETVFGIGWLHLWSMGMNVFAGGRLEPVAPRPLFWMVWENSASNLPSFN